MKNYSTKFILFSLFLLLNFSSQAQNFPYTLVTETDTYADLEEATVLTSEGDNWDDPEFEMPIGFDFEFFGKTYTEVYLTGLGSFLVFADINSTDSLELLIPYIDDIMDIENIDENLQSSISHTTEGP